MARQQRSTSSAQESTRPITWVALYARVSTLNNQDPEMQLAELREYAGRRGWQVVEEFPDQGVSGCKESRPALNRMMSDACRRCFDAVFRPLGTVLEASGQRSGRTRGTPSGIYQPERQPRPEHPFRKPSEMTGQNCEASPSESLQGASAMNGETRHFRSRPPIEGQWLKRDVTQIESKKTPPPSKSTSRLWKESVEIAVVRQPVDLPAVTLNPLAGMMGVIAMSHQLPKSLLPSFFRQLVLTRWARHAKRVLCAWLN